MNARAYKLALKWRRDLESLPGADSISFHAQDNWALFLIMTSSDAAVISLGEELGLAYDIKSEEGRWWRFASGEREGGALRCEISGPRHRGQPPGFRTERTCRMATAPVTLTAAQVLEAARACGVPAFESATGERQILLASLGLDLACAEIRDALLELHQCGELRLVQISDPSVVRANLDARGLRFELLDDSVIRDGDTIFHAVTVP